MTKMKELRIGDRIKKDGGAHSGKEFLLVYDLRRVGYEGIFPLLGVRTEYTDPPADLIDLADSFPVMSTLEVVGRGPVGEESQPAGDPGEPQDLSMHHVHNRVVQQYGEVMRDLTVALHDEAGAKAVVEDVNLRIKHLSDRAEGLNKILLDIEAAQVPAD